MSNDLKELKFKIGQLIFPRIKGSTPDNFQYDNYLYLVEHIGIGGLIISGGTKNEMLTWFPRLKNKAHKQLIVAADMENGAGEQFSDAPVYPHALAIGKTREPFYAYQLAKLSAIEARKGEVNCIFAPVIDINTNPLNPIINVRAYGEYPELVCNMIIKAIQGYKEGGVLSCAKHYPGHGDVNEDSHMTLPVLNKTLDDLIHLEFLPYYVAIEAGVDLIMSTHLSVPKIDPSGVPATLSKILITDILRNELGFKGAIITDAMVMEGVSHIDNENELCLKAFLAGNDIILMPFNPVSVYNYFCKAIEKGIIPEDRVNEAYNRLEYLRTKLKKMAVPAHVEEIEEDYIINIASQAIMLKGTIPEEISNSINFENNEPDDPQEKVKSIFLCDTFNFDKAITLVEKTYFWEHSFYYPSSNKQIYERELKQLDNNRPAVFNIFSKAGGWKTGGLKDYIDKIPVRDNILIILWGNPYLIDKDKYPNILFAHSDVSFSQIAVTNFIFGKTIY